MKSELSAERTGKTGQSYLSSICSASSSPEAAKRRSITAIAGPPGAGKSAVAERLASALNLHEPGSVAILPMDGFHLDDSVLIARDLLQRKGAPETFDFGGLASALSRLKANLEAEIAVPVFDRAVEISRAGARIFRPCRSLDHRVTIPRAATGA